MATLTRNLLIAEGGLLTVDYTYDDVALDLLSVTVTNQTTNTYTVTATSTSAGNKNIPSMACPVLPCR